VHSRTKRLYVGRSRRSKAEVVELVRRPGNSVASVARDLDLTETAVRAWVKQADIDDGDRDGLTSAQLAELAPLRVTSPRPVCPRRNDTTGGFRVIASDVTGDDARLWADAEFTLASPDRSEP
jgi:transposase-like protein